MPRMKLSFGSPSLADTHIARGDADDGAALVIKNFGCGKARVDLNAKLRRLLAEPTAERLPRLTM